MMRRKNTGRMLLALLLCGELIVTACSTSWVSQAEEIIAVLVPATANLVTLVGTLSGRVSAADLQTIQEAGAQAGADLELVRSLITQYQNATVVSQAGLLNRIQATITATQSNLRRLTPALHIKDAATQAKVTAVVGLLLSEVQSMAAIVPLVDPTASPAMMKMAARQVKKQPPLTASDFVTSYNATMTAKTGDAGLDRATTRLRIHRH